MSPLPPFKSAIDLYWQRFCEACPPATLEAIEQALTKPGKREQLQRCWTGSAFAAELCIKHPTWLAEQLADIALPGLPTLIACVQTENELQHALRTFRNRWMLRIIWRDFNRIASTRETIAELSLLADTCIRQALDFLHEQLARTHGRPRNDRGEEQCLLVLGMGKLGAHELNLSSDIDLIFAYPDEGETDDPQNSVSNQQFFIKLGQKLIRALDQTTLDGFVFRVDMALRPYGESGALVCNFDAMESYYQEQGRSWERYAMVKARIVTGDPVQSDILMKMLRGFTYRRYIDFSVIESLREMKALISREVKRKGYQDNVKLGAGGIREIEFIVQAFQLIRGGRETEFQQREILNILPLLQHKQLLPEQTVTELTEAYLFLRNTEHVLQGYQDHQTQMLPVDSTERERAAWVMGFSGWNDFYNHLKQHRDNVSRHFKFVAAFEDDYETEKAEPITNGFEWLLELWETYDEADKQALVHEHLSNHDGLTETISALHQLQHSKVVQSLQPESRRRLDQFMPRLLREALSTAAPCETLLRLFPFVYAVLRRSAYLVLLNENPRALRQLVLLSAASPWIAEELATHPVLLDELLDERSLYSLPDRQKIENALRQEVLRIPLDDLEAQMEALRYFKQAHRLRVAACEVTERLPLMKVSDYLTFLAEAILEHALQVAWHTMTSRYGTPTCSDGSAADPAFVIVGYGKLGGLELGHNSDLDVVFIHGADPLGSTHHPEQSIDNATFYARIGQRIIHILEARTPSGQLYEIDTELRPSGNSGLLVSSLEAFDKYQTGQAWTWEHQALVRARVVAGCPKLAEAFQRIRNRVLSRRRDAATLKKEVVEMRAKMVKHLASGSEHVFDLKQDRGGIIDIEFMVQYAVLAWTHTHPQLLRWPDNIRILEELGTAGLFNPADARQLIETYKVLRCAAHRLALQQQGSKVDGAQFQPERQFVRSLWQQLFSEIV